MISKNELKYIQSLCHKKFRDEHKCFIAEGPKLVNELIDEGMTFEKIYALSEYVPSKLINVPIQEISEIELKKMSNLNTPNLVFAIVKQPVHSSVFNYHNQLTIALDGIQDPGNLGTIIRLADWFGIKQILMSEDTVECYNPKVVQSTMGSIARIAFKYTKLDKELELASVPVYGAVLNGRNVFEMERLSEGIILIGNEGKGISSDLLQKIHQPITIPKKGKAESLNAAMAAGIIISHLCK